MLTGIFTDMIIYELVNRVTGKRYVGQTTLTLDERWQCHVKNSGAGRRQRLYDSMRYHGHESFDRHVLQGCQCIEDLDDAERFWIAKLCSNKPEFGYNMTSGGQQRGRMTEEVRQRLSELNSGKNNPFFGQHHTPEARKAIGMAQAGNQHAKGNILTPEQKRRQSDGLKKHWAESLERKRALSERMKRTPRKRRLNDHDIRRILQRLVSGEKACLIAADYQVSPSMITRVKKGQLCASK